MSWLNAEVSPWPGWAVAVREKVVSMNRVRNFIMPPVVLGLACLL